MKTLFVGFVLLCFSSLAFAGGASNAWNDPWAFPSPGERANLLNQALAIELVEGGGFQSTTNNSFFYETNCSADGACLNGDAIAIGNNITIDGSGNLVVTKNDGNVGAQNNNGPGAIIQGNEVDNGGPQ